MSPQKVGIAHGDTVFLEPDPDSLIVMSMLQPEYDALVEARERHAAGVA